MNSQVRNSLDDQMMDDRSRYNITNSGIDEILYQKVASKLNCSAQQEQRSIVSPLYDDDPENEYTGMLETYDTSALYDPSNTWMCLLILALVVILIVLLYKYHSPTLSAETIRATILGYSP